jgi:hypothetical protein
MNENAAQMEDNFLECNICEETFETRQELEAHNRRFHSAKAERGAGSGAEQRFPNTGQHAEAGKNPPMDASKKDKQHSQRTGRKGPESQEETERPNQARKRAAS